MMKGIKVKTINSKKVYSGKIFDLYKDNIIINKKIKSSQEYIVYPEAAGIIPITDDGKIILIEQYRHANKTSTLEIPAGKKDPGENIIKCAKRELEEETGYKAKVLKKLCDYFPVASYSTEKLHIFIAKGLIKGSANPDEDEIFNIHLFTLDNILKLISKNVIKDSKTIISILFYKNFIISQ